MSTEQDVILQMRHIVKRFGPVTALDDVNITVKRGQIFSVCGENGAGKSTLMNVLSGVYPYGSYEGEVVYDGQTCQFNTIRDSEAKGIVIIHQELALVPYMSITDNIFLGNPITKEAAIDDTAQRKVASEALQAVGLDENPDTLIANIGVGKQQLVEIAKALTKNVKLLILDEPTAALNDEDSAHLLGLIDDLRRNKGITAIIISHKLNEIAESADAVQVIRDGKTISHVDIDKEHPLDQDLLIRDMVGRPLTNRYPEHESSIGEEVFRVENWRVHHPLDVERLVAKDVCLNMRAGEIVGLAGLIGAGRTETAMSIFGHQYGVKASGHLYMGGQEVSFPTVRSAIDHGVAYATEDRKTYGLNLIKSIRENTSLASLKAMSHAGVIDREREARVSEDYRKQLRIKTPSIEVPTGNLSGGNQQKVVLAKWMATNPKLLILDEPTRGIDVGAKYDIYEIIDQLADKGSAVLVISSELPELLGICDRIYTMSQGIITACLDAKRTNQEELMRFMTSKEPMQQAV
ncbi:L-arabinose ABC superfamily ATP binding cassette transporter, ABC protein [Bifidobacterium actinocoloniiforme DSM 22766]|uniref:L-arabinose ABC superfamily ATP binding cassette transporter, ABC protein n=1 Tax=Bifidobacterium actinocoloniiforme DSM 22766 TaxID=1437605 RepID=A0A086Z104_9BIFI|nr:sugar ABC transporter ATP-binding protein [Bifidobacterium actinocoloniiforme]AKV55385.1 ABC transporter ATP-binding protein [Bifidobacterium actinocoloniiforme DSM 22766]KFI40204.1 L-arabinose ABC superfamily ATP binding cassette transporter, ABC protein [Bifidobacterium actinocoloniiforme DSM 22766]